MNLFGSWDGTWQMDNSVSGVSHSGSFVFSKGGTVRVTPNVYSENLLASDTLSDTSTYRVENNKILLFGKENVILKYLILFLSFELIELMFLDDIRRTLKR